MNNLQISNINSDENSYLSFSLGENKYAVKVSQIIEIMKLPQLDYPQRLPNNIIGLLKYDNLVINILDLRFYLDIKVSNYTVTNQLLIVKTDESIFGLIIDKAEDIFAVNSTNIEPLPSSSQNKLIDFLYKKNSETITTINLNIIEKLLKDGVKTLDIDIPSLFPKDEASKTEFLQRNLNLQAKDYSDFAINMFYQDKYVTFSLNENKYCINFQYVSEFLKNVSITKFPCNRDYIAGIIALRGDFIGIIDFKRFLGDINSSKELTVNDFKTNNIILLENTDYKIGILVDKIFGIETIPDEHTIKGSSAQNNKYVLREVFMNDEIYTVLNMETIFSDEKLFIEEN